MEIVGLVLAIVIGVSLGLLGGGGSILAVPVFVYVLGLDPKLAIAVSLGVVGLVSAGGVIPHARAGRVEMRAGLLFAAGSAAGAFGGSGIAGFVSGTVQLVVFAIVMLVAALLMMRPRPEGPRGSSRTHGVRDIIRLLMIALVVGVTTGFVGVGGGFLIVPAFVLLGGMKMSTAAGTSLMVIAINSAAGFAGYWMKPELRLNIEGATVGGLPLLVFSLIFTGVATVGVVGGGLLAHRVSSAALRRAFAWFLIAVAIAILVQKGGW